MKELIKENIEFGEYYQIYFNKAHNLPLVETLTHSLEETITFLKNIPESKHSYTYAAGKWNLKEIVQHLIDTERMFLYRALRISRNDKTPIAGYDHDVYVQESYSSERDFHSLLEEYSHVRKSSILFFENMPQENLERIGLANGNPFSPRAIAYIICGHERHHLGVYGKRYVS